MPNTKTRDPSTENQGRAKIKGQKEERRVEDSLSRARPTLGRRRAEDVYALPWGGALRTARPTRGIALAGGAGFGFLEGS